MCVGRGVTCWMNKCKPREEKKGKETVLKCFLASLTERVKEAFFPSQEGKKIVVQWAEQKNKKTLLSTFSSLVLRPPINLFLLFQNTSAAEARKKDILLPKAIKKEQLSTMQVFNIPDFSGFLNTDMHL